MKATATAKEDQDKPAKKDNSGTVTQKGRITKPVTKYSPGNKFQSIEVNYVKYRILHTTYNVVYNWRGCT